MTTLVTITELESAINRLRESAPPANYILSPDLRAMADVYGRMISGHAELLDLAKEPEALRQVILKWLPQKAEATTACAYRIGDSGSECEACQ